MDYYEQLVANWSDSKLRERVAYLHRLRRDHATGEINGRALMILEAAEWELIGRERANA